MPSTCIWPVFISLSEPLVEIYLLPGVFLGNNSLRRPRAAISMFFSCCSKSLCPHPSLSLVQVKLLSGHWLSWLLKDT